VQLDEACCRTRNDACIGGPLLLLSIWSWKRFPVGWPKLLSDKDYLDQNNDLQLPTWAYHWDVISEFTSEPQAAYQTYTNEFDNLVSEQVHISILSIFLISDMYNLHRLYCGTI
jgi:hypothetical protein